MPRALLLASVLLLCACGKDSSSPGGYGNPASSLEEARAEAKRTLGEHGEKARAVWDSTPQSAAWTESLLRKIAFARATLETALDREEFCPGYGSATSYQQDTCWLRIFSAIARFESNLRADATHVEADGATSVGLFMMNPAHCARARSVDALKAPLANIECAVDRFTLLLARDHWISGAHREGAASYWEVLREPHKVGSLFLGRRPHILLFTQSYAGFPEP